LHILTNLFIIIGWLDTLLQNFPNKTHKKHCYQTVVHINI
jgi:hypothetical protein